MVGYKIECADVVQWARAYSGPKFHALLCDPPYHLHSGKGGGFMGMKWDGAHDIAFNPDTWAALAQHLYPGAFGMAFASSRGWHRLAVAIEDAGLVIHPSIFNWKTGKTLDIGLLGWGFGSGFPKATRIDTQVDKAAGATREVIGPRMSADGRCRTLEPSGGKERSALHGGGIRKREEIDTAPATPLAAVWEGHRYGLQALKPALEPIIVFQKPYEGKPVDSITATGAGALWIDGARIGVEGGGTHCHRRDNNGKCLGHPDRSGTAFGITYHAEESGLLQGRWPANLALTHASTCNGECVDGCPVRALDEQADASRFFHNTDWSLEVAEQLAMADPVKYAAKASRRERDAGLEDRNPHPTVKPVSLAQWLASLLLAPAAYAPRRILIPFSGVGSEMIGAGLAGWDEAVGVEMNAEYTAIAEARLRHWLGQAQQLELVV